MTFPKAVRIVEVGPRDGLQNEKQIISAQEKIKLIESLVTAGLKAVEVTSFVSPKWIPQLADHNEVWQGLKKEEGIQYPVLVPNMKGLLAADALGIKHIAVFTTPSEAFSKKNTHCSVAESKQRIVEVMTAAKEKNIKVRGYLSCVLGCPYEGDIPAEKVAELAQFLQQAGCYEISLGDTIGTGSPFKTEQLIKTVADHISLDQIAVHFHDTYGLALTNIYVALSMGVKTVDSAVAGLGGCPYAKGASGNVATEDVVYMLEKMGISTGVDLAKLIQVGRNICQLLNRPMQSKVNIATANPS